MSEEEFQDRLEMERIARNRASLAVIGIIYVVYLVAEQVTG